jgi:hypothetical protein
MFEIDSGASYDGSRQALAAYGLSVQKTSQLVDDPRSAERALWEGVR